MGGEALSFALVDNAGNSFPDGQANDELQANPDRGVRGVDAAALEKSASQSGGFAVVISAGSGASLLGTHVPKGCNVV